MAHVVEKLTMNNALRLSFLFAVSCPIFASIIKSNIVNTAQDTKKEVKIDIS
jgi:hypothetical protein